MKLNSSFRNLVALSILGFFATFSSSVFAADTTVAQPAPQSAPAEVKTDYKDAFLKFVLDKAEKYSGAAEQAVSKAVDVATEQAPEVAKEYIRWQLFYHGTCVVLPIVFFGVFFPIFLWQWPKWETNVCWSCLERGSTGNVIATVIAGLGSVINLIVFFVNLDNLFSFIQLLVAPRIYIIEQVLHLIK